MHDGTPSHSPFNLKIRILGPVVMQNMTGIANLEKLTTTGCHAFATTRRRHTSILHGSIWTRIPGNFTKQTRRTAFRSMGLSDHFNQVGSKLSLNPSTFGMEHLRTTLTSDSTISNDTAIVRDRMHRDHSWKEWLDYISEVESAENELGQLFDDLHENVTMENFKEAARIKSRIHELGSKDLVHSTHLDLDKAIEEERFDDAARLRDDGLVGLCGWWVARGADDYQGKLVYIQKDYCRYTGRLFSPKDFGSLCGLSEAYIPDDFLSERDDSMDNLGAFALEVFLKNSDSGRILRQACVLRTPVFENEDGTIDVHHSHPEVKYQMESDASGQPMELTVTVVENDDDITTHLFDEEDAEQIAAIIMSDDSDDEDDDIFDGYRHRLVITNDSDDSNLNPLEIHQRFPADIKWWDRNRFVLSVEDDVQNGADSDNDEENDTEEDEYQDELFKAISAAIDKIQLPEFESVAPKLNAFSKKLKSARRHSFNHNERGESTSGIDVQFVDFMKKQILAHIEDNDNNLEGEVMFTRLPHEECMTDTFTGYFIGHFGIHGPELLHLTRQKDKLTEKEILIARKITGDENVPAGEISFRVSIDRTNRSVPDAMHEELGVRAFYRGKGRTAQQGFVNPEWVDGDLLVFDPNSPLGGGAELGMVWNVPDRSNRHRDYSKIHILLHRIALPEIE